jgi:hypothetical protein
MRHHHSNRFFAFIEGDPVVFRGQKWVVGGGTHAKFFRAFRG